MTPVKMRAVGDPALAPRPRASESMVPPAVALAIMDEKAAPERPRAKSIEPTGPARGVKIGREGVDGSGLGPRFAEHGGGDHDDEGGHDAGCDDAGDRVDEGDVAVVGAGAAVFLDAVGRVEGGVDGEVGADQCHDEDFASGGQLRDHAFHGPVPVGLGDDSAGNERDAHEDDDDQERLLDDSVDVPEGQDEGRRRRCRQRSRGPGSRRRPATDQGRIPRRCRRRTSG